MILAVIGAALIITFTFVRPPEPHKAGLRPPDPAPTAPAPPPAAPSPTHASEPVPPPAPPTFDVVRISRTCTAVMAGKAQAGMVVVVRSGERELGRVTADARGEWAMVPDLPLPSGTQELRLSGVLQGKEAIPGHEAVTVVVPNCAPGLPDPGEQAIAVLTPREGGSRLMQPPAPEGDVSAAKGLTLDTVDYDERGQLLLSGRASPGTTVQIYLNNQPLGTAVADAKGRWTLQPRDHVAPGIYTLRADQVQETGKVAARVEVPFSRAKPEELAETDGRIIVQPGNSLWRLARRAYGEGGQFTVIYQANKAQIRDPDLIYPGQVFSVPGKPAEKPRGKAE